MQFPGQTLFKLKKLIVNEEKRNDVQSFATLNTLDIPKPYAFNYHFDNGVFRGLAFANYRTPEDTDLVVSALNGYEVAGRKLRVEYKRVLPAAEREAKERENKSDNGRNDKEKRDSTIKSPAPDQLDLNDPETLKFIQVIIFRDDKSREELVFPKTLSSAHRPSAAINIKQTPRNGSFEDHGSMTVVQ
ncbi:unnamed protein product [Rhizophagus irregularis]|nr:unnamed protein product [Rhizophagus irregularis]